LVGRIVWIAIAVAALLYGAAQAAIRSPWFRVAVERRLSKATGMEVRVGRIRPTESLNLRISDISVLEDRAGMEVKVLRVKWTFLARRGFSRIRKLIVEDAVLTMAPDDEGNLLPSFVGDRAWELVSGLTQGRLQNPPDADAANGHGPGGTVPVREGDAPARTGGQTSRDFAGIRNVRLIRGTFSLRDAGGNERASAKDVEIGRRIDLDAEGRRVERWNVQAAMLSAEGMQLPNLDWSAEFTEEGGWNVTRFASDGWSAWSPAESPDGVERTTEEYRKLLDSI
jgi:hypothetical protein